MIVATMTMNEIRNEFLSDCRDVQIYCKLELMNWNKRFSAYVRKLNKPCVFKTFSIKTFKGNLIKIIYRAKDRGHHNKPEMTFYTSFQTEKGKSFLVMTNYKEVTILTPHFVRRYRERVLENNVSLSSEEVIEKIINKDNFALSFRINDELESIAKCFDGHYKNQGNDYVTQVNSGWIFGNIDSRVRLCKTIIVEKMLNKNQKALFDEMKLMHAVLDYDKRML